MIVVACILRYDQELFAQITSTTADLPLNFLRCPTKYSKYLRKTLACWYADKAVNINNISNVQVASGGMDSDCDSDSDMPRCTIEQQQPKTNITPGQAPSASTTDQNLQSPETIKTRNKDKNETSEAKKCLVCSMIFTTQAICSRHIQHSKILSRHCDKYQNFDYGCSSYHGNEAQSPDFGIL